MKKLHLKRYALDRLALCGVWPDRRFVLIEALPRQAEGAVCRPCIQATAANVERKDDGVPAVPSE